MNNLDMKNIIVLKDLPSNTIDEAIVILKDNKIKKKSDTNRDSEEYMYNNIVNEAEDIILDYIERLEAPKKEKINERKLLIKYKKLQMLTLIFGAVMMATILISLIK